MNKDINIATLIISSNTYPANRNSKAQKKLFFQQGFNPQLTYWYKAGNKKELKGKKFKVNKNNLLIDTSDSTLNMGMKTLLALEWLNQNYEFDFVVRPTPSSYLNYSNLESFIVNNLIETKYVYAGIVHNTNSGKIQSDDKHIDKEITFISGSTLILSKSTVEKILENKSQWDHSYWDDVALALLLKNLQIEYQPAERFDVTGNPLKQQIPDNYYQYRCRADNHFGYPRYLESINLKIVHKFSNNIKINNIYKIAMLFFYSISKKFYVYQFGWKVYETIRKALRVLLSEKVYKFIKKLFITKIDKFKHVRFKT